MSQVLASEDEFSFIVVGGGISGVTCVETLASLNPDVKTLLITASPVVKAVTNFAQITKTLEKFEVKEALSTELTARFPNLTVVNGLVTRLCSKTKEVKISDGRVFKYKKLCLCIGASPKVIAKDHPYVLGIRDTETVQAFEEKLKDSCRIVVIGNGGIATELVYKIKCCDVVWAIKDASIVSTFVDAGAAKFFLPNVSKEKTEPEGPLKRRKYQLEDDVAVQCCTKALGCALGPDWTDSIAGYGRKDNSRYLEIEYRVEVKSILTPEEVKSGNLTVTELQRDNNGSTNDKDWPVYVELTNGKIYGCDFIVSATGVTPNVKSSFDSDIEFDVADDGGIKVNSYMQTSVSDVFAAGDICHAAWEHSPFWLQMRLWDQARQMGHYAAKCMVADLEGQLDDVQMDFCFELFAHITKFFDFKVVLLGKFNGQGLSNDHKLLIRVNEGEQYVKAVMQEGKMVGAVLVGETDLEETFENLILNQLDLSRFGDELLHQDIEDYFD